MEYREKASIRLKSDSLIEHEAKNLVPSDQNMMKLNKHLEIFTFRALLDPLMAYSKLKLFISQKLIMKNIEN